MHVLHHFHRFLGLAICLGFAFAGDVSAQVGGSNFQGLKALFHEEASVRYKAAAVLARLGPQAKFARAELHKALKDSDPLVRLKVAEAIWKVEQPEPGVLLPTLTKSLRHEDVQVRVSAARVLGIMGKKAKLAGPSLLRALNDKDFQVKTEVLLALADIAPPARTTAPALLNMTSDKDLFLYEPVLATTLGSLGPDAVPALREALVSKDEAKRRVAVAALNYLGADARAAATALARAAADNDSFVRATACSALGKIGKDAGAAHEVLAKACADPSATVRIHAARALWQITGEPKMWKVIVAATSDEDAFNRQEACEALAEMGPELKELRVVAALTGALEDMEWRVRRAAVLGLAKLPPATARPSIEALKKRLADAEQAVRLETAFAVWKVTGEAGASLKVLTEFLNEDSTQRQFELRGRALELTAQMGPAGQPLGDLLLAIVRDVEADYRQQAASTLKAIDPKKAAAVGIR